MSHKAESPGGILLLEVSDPEHDFPIYELWDEDGHMVAWVAWSEERGSGMVHFTQEGHARLDAVADALERARARHEVRTT